MFVNKYRPTQWSDLIGRQVEVTKLKELIASQDGLPHCLFSGKQGSGKTSTAEVIAIELFGRHKNEMFTQFNSSADRGIDTIRGPVLELAKKRPVYGKYKIIFMDEASEMTADAQNCLRAIMEKYFSITRFIFAANYKHKIIAPIISRCVEFDFLPYDTKTVALHLKKIAKLENLNFQDSEFINFAKLSSGDIRKALNLMEGIKEDVSAIEVWDKMTKESLKSIPRNDRIMMAFSTDPDAIYSAIWEFIKREKLWEYLPLMADTQHKMNFSIQKTVFLCDLLAKIGDL